MKTKFRISAKDTITAYLYSESGKLLTIICDSGYTRISQVESALMRKCCHPPRNTRFSITNEDKGTYWTNR